MQDRRILHLVGQAHLDPVWLWPWQEGCSEALTTVQSAVNCLEAEADLCFTRSSAAIYRWVEAADPALFARVRALVQAGRWEIVGGWIEQPDCNLPATEAFVRQSLLGKAYFQRTFGVDVRIGYNVDSFGHAAGLPQLLHRAGFTHYVMMRPQAWEMYLPLLFWWESTDGSRVLTWRLPQNYGQPPQADTAAFTAELHRAVASAFPAGARHGLFFYGVGNHGGGPTRRQIEVLRRHQEDPALPELRFSTVGRFFAALAADGALADLPTVRGELNRHAPGCYSAHRRIKQDNRRTERALVTAEGLLTAGALSLPTAAPVPALEGAWTRLLFNQFHDILAGTCTASNDAAIRDRFGAAADEANEVAGLALRRLARAVDARGVPEGSLLVWNPLPWPRPAVISFDAFVAPHGDAAIQRLVAVDDDAEFPVQWTAAETCFGPMGSRWQRLNAVVPLPACGYRLFRLDHGAPAGTAAPTVGSIAARSDAPGLAEPLPVGLGVWADPGDTWGHRLHGYDERLGAPTLLETVELEAGIWRRTVRQRARWGASDLLIYFRRWAHRPGIEITVRCNWQEAGAILRLELATGLVDVTSVAAVPGAIVERPDNAGEQPANDWVAATGRRKDGTRHSCLLVSDGSLSYCTANGTLQVIVARSAFYAHHRPQSPPDPWENARLDLGWHEARFWLHDGLGEPAALNPGRFAADMLNPPLPAADSAHPGTLPTSGSILEVEAANLNLTACKLSADGRAWIVRLQETRGTPVTCDLRSTLPVRRTWRVAVGAWALATFRLPLAGPGPAQPADLLEQPLPPS
ncbi:MAG: alpha-mannosidase [Gemmataceae bacterium]|nr:alpha-mannosidase [Gemmataceae bacterium]